MRLPWRKKIPVIGVFSLGVFTILAAILNKVYSFSQPFGAAWTYWYVRESSTALLVANLPFVWTLWRRSLGMAGTVIGIPQHDLSSQSGHSPRMEPERKLSASSLANASSPRRSDDLELSIGAGLTLADMLGEENPVAKTGKPPTPITHPSLFYCKKSRDEDTDTIELYMEKAVLRDKREQQTIRRGSETQDVVPDSPEASIPQSASSKKSAKFFV